MLKIYGLDFSPWVNRVRFTANHIGLEYQYINIDLLNGEGQSEDYLKIHPAGKVPAIDDDGFTVFESDAICRYLVKKSASPLYPSDLQASTLVDQWSGYSVMHIAAAMQKVLFNRLIYKMVDQEQDTRSLAEGLEFLQRFLPIIDSQLGSNTHLAGEMISLADIVLLAWLDPAEVCELDLTQYQNINNWRKQLKKQAFYTACFSDYADLFKDAA